jgi:Cu/Ag efflux pump CusA
MDSSVRSALASEKVPIAAPIVGGMITSTIHVLILVPVFFALMKNEHSALEP